MNKYDLLSDNEAISQSVDDIMGIIFDLMNSKGDYVAKETLDRAIGELRENCYLV